MTTFTSSKARELALRIQQAQSDHEREIARLEAEARAENERLDAAFAKAGRARFALVEDLLEHFQISPAEPVPMLNKRTKEPLVDREGNPRMENPDENETQRMERLREALTAALRNSESAPLTTSHEHP